MGSFMKHHRKNQKKRTETLRLCEDQLRRADVTILYTLHTHPKFKFGAKRCREFYLDMIRNHFKMCDQWQSNGDDSHYLIMEKRLKDAGIDVQALQAEAHELAKELNGR